METTLTLDCVENEVEDYAVLWTAIVSTNTSACMSSFTCVLGSDGLDLRVCLVFCVLFLSVLS